MWFCQLYLLTTEYFFSDEADINDAETDITEAASDAEQEERSDEEASTRKRRRVS